MYRTRGNPRRISPRDAGPGISGYRNRPFRSQSPPRGRPTLRNFEKWTKWLELKVRLSKMPTNVTTLDIYEAFASEGSITQIELQEDGNGNSLGEAYVIFSPPPVQAFWDHPDGLLIQMQAGQTIKIEAQLQPKRTFILPSPVDPRRHYPERLKITLSQVDFGYMHRKDEMMIMHTVWSRLDASATLCLDLLRREMTVEFSVPLEMGEGHSTNSQFDRIKFQVPIHQLESLIERDSSDSELGLILTLDHAPNFYRRLHDAQLTFPSGRYWNERFRWARMTEIRRFRHESNGSLEPAPFQLKRSDDIVDIGRWTTYRMSFSKRGPHSGDYGKIKQALQDYNVKFLRASEIKFREPQETDTTVWDLIDFSNKPSPDSSLAEMAGNSTFCLPWPLRYQLESCISLNAINEGDVSKEFISHLVNLPLRTALSKLEAAAEAKKRFENPFESLNLPISTNTLSRQLPDYCIALRSVIVTPTTIYYKPPSPEMSNRVLRHYQEHADRFIRVKFTEEKSEGRIQAAADNDTLDAVYTRIYNFLAKGFIIGDRHFEFLAMGNSQFREHGAYFFASTPSLSAGDIRSKLGKIGNFNGGQFVSEKIIAKYASRLGQCFSTTRPIRGTTIKVIETCDVKRNGYIFTDGVGMISPFLARLISLELGLPSRGSDIPSLFQFRMGGTKGVLAVSPLAKDNQVYIRESQIKFAAVHEGLEVIKWSEYRMPRLNRQLITVLSCLGVSDEVFLSKLGEELSQMDQAMTNEAVAQAILRRNIDYNHMTLVVANIMTDGFMRVQDPFAQSILHLWRSWTTKQLKEKAALSIAQGAFVFGCTDETASLRGYFWNSMPPHTATLEEKIKALPQIFIQISDPDVPGAHKVIKDRVCLVARNPSLHPGDIRVVHAVDVHDLHHLKDVVVFPQTGDRDIPSMCSGGDLDGDDFIVIWDERLIPAETQWDNPAMDFTSPTPKRKENGEVDVQDIIKFFIQYMKTDTLRTIATAHLANADKLPGGIRNPKCLKLAQMHSIAVDYPKSGVPAAPIGKLRPNGWPHFMPSKYRRKDQVYNSETVLGKLYDMVPQASFEPIMKYKFDERILGAFQLDESILEAAAKIKKDYDAAMRRIMAQQAISTEFEVWTTFVMEHARLSNDYKFHEEIGRLSEDLKSEFKKVCHSQAGGKNFEKLAPFVAAMYAVTANEMTDALSKFDEIQMVNATELPLISFPWLFHHELGKIACGARKAGNTDFHPSDQPVEAETAEPITTETVQLIDFNTPKDYGPPESGVHFQRSTLELLSELFEGQNGDDPMELEDDGNAEDHDTTMQLEWTDGNEKEEGEI